MISLKKLLAGTLSAAMVLGTTFIPAFADETKAEFEIGDGKQYATFADACTAANSSDASEITYNVYGKVVIDSGISSANDIWVAPIGTDNTTVTKVNFVGKDNAAEINISNKKATIGFSCGEVSADVTYTDLKLSKDNCTYERCDLDRATEYFSTFLRCSDSDKHSVTYTSCTFSNGVLNNPYGKTVFNDCTFNNPDSGKYALWIQPYKKTTLTGYVEVNGGKIDAPRGIKAYAHGQSINAQAKIIGTSITTTDKPALVASEPGAFEFENIDISGCAQGLARNDKGASILLNGKTPFYEAKVGDYLFTSKAGALAEANNDISKVKDINVQVNGKGFETLTEALTYVYKNGPYADPVTIDCKQYADLGTMTHGHVADDIIINGNGAFIPNGEPQCEHDLEIDTWRFSRSTGAQATDGDYLKDNIKIVVNELDGIAAWGQRNTDYTIDLEFYNCQNMNRVYFTGTSGVTNIKLNGCSFNGETGGVHSNETNVYSNQKGMIEINNCEFSNTALAINLNNKSDGEQKISVKNSTFKDCATNDVANRWNKFAAPIRFVTSGDGATTNVSIEDSNISYSNGITNIGNGDILIGDGRGGQNKSNPDVTLNVKGTSAEVQTHYPDKAPVKTNVSNTEEKTLKMTSSPAKVKTVFKESTDEVENGKAYDLYVEADGEIINKLTSAHFTFELSTTDRIEYELKPAENVSITGDTANANRYLFNFNGTEQSSATGREIKLGQVIFTGVGTFSFGITGSDNVINATKTVDNIVQSYIAAETADDTLDVSEGLNDITLTQETKNLTVKVSFPNAIEDQLKAYQNMAVKVSGNGITKEVNLGSDADAAVVEFDDTNKVYTVSFNDTLIKNNTYTVTVSGAGYRTARYTVSMTGNKTLNFWNNVMDAPAFVEEGVGTASQTNFLAGDIVKDGQINIYDLSAVISYFGTDNRVSTHSAYAKYDLNRDGKIDSKDVSYVLVSWGK